MNLPKLLIPALSSDPFPVISFHADNDGISRDFHFIIYLIHPRKNASWDLQDQYATLLWKNAHTSFERSGVVHHTTSLGEIEKGFLYALTMSSPLHLLTHCRQNRIFRQKTLETILMTLFAPHALSYVLTAKQHEIIHMIQLDQNDFEFFEAVLSQASLAYQFEFNAHTAKLVIYDPHTPPTIETHTLPFHLSSSPLPSEYCLWEISSTPDITYATSNAPDLTPGQLLTITGHPCIHFNRTYTIQSITHHYQNAHYHNRLQLSTHPHFLKKNTPKSFFLWPGKIDPNYSDRTRHENTVPVQLLATANAEYLDARCSQESASFPWHAQDEVALAFLHGDVSTPVIIGAHHHFKTPNPVNTHNRRHNTLQTPLGHIFLMNDDPQCQRITLQTARHQHEMQLDRNAARIVVRSPQGKIDSYASEALHLHSYHFSQTAGHDLLHDVQTDHRTYATTMKYRAGQHLALFARHTIHLQAHTHPTDINVHGDIALHALQHLAIESKQAQWTSHQGDIELSSEHTLRFQADQITLKQGLAQIQWAEGRTVLHAEQITFRAPKIVVWGKTSYLTGST